MKKLYINRHAKSSWDNPNDKDFDRPLNKRGLRDAPFMAGEFVRNNASADLILSSPAVRALETAKHFAQALNKPESDIHIDERIYHASTKTLVQVLNEIDDKYESAIIFGHNPGLAYLVQYLTGEYMRMTTCAIAGVDLHLDSWKAVGMDTGTLFAYDYPKNHFPS